MKLDDLQTTQDLPRVQAYNLIRTHLVGGGPWSAPTDDDAAEGVIRAIKLTEGRPAQTRLLGALARCMSDPDPAVRAEAVYIGRRFARRIGPTLFAALLDRAPQLYRGVPSADGDRALETSLLMAIGASAGPGQTEHVDRLKAASADLQHRSWILAALTRLDPEWVLGQTPAILVGAESDACLPLIALADPAQRQRYVDAVAAGSDEMKASLVTELSDPYGAPDVGAAERAALLGALGS